MSSAAEIQADVLDLLVDRYGEDHRKACGTAADLATSLFGCRRQIGWLIDCYGQRHEHHWAIAPDGGIVDPLAKWYDEPIRYETVEEERRLWQSCSDFFLLVVNDRHQSLRAVPRERAWKQPMSTIASIGELR